MNDIRITPSPHGRWEYVPSGGHVLDAQEFADFLNVIHEGRGDYSSRDRLREKFPTSEHDEARLQRNPETLARIKSALASTDGDTEVTGQDFLDALPTGPDCWDVCEGHPAPAVPAEEETKAEESQTVYDEAVSLSYWLAQQLGEHVDDASDRGETLTDTVQRLIEHIRPNRGKTSSSPVVPAPAETEWPTWQEVPDGVWYISRDYPISLPAFVNRDGVRYLAKVAVEASTTDMNTNLAPFVAAEEGDA